MHQSMDSPAINDLYPDDIANSFSYSNVFGDPGSPLDACSLCTYSPHGFSCGFHGATRLELSQDFQCDTPSSTSSSLASTPPYIGNDCNVQVAADRWSDFDVTMTGVYSEKRHVKQAVGANSASSALLSDRYSILNLDKRRNPFPYPSFESPSHPPTVTKMLDAWSEWDSWDSPALQPQPSDPYSLPSSYPSLPSVPPLSHISAPAESSSHLLFSSSHPYSAQPSSIYPLPLHQPQPVRPIPPIPLSEFSIDAEEELSPLVDYEEEGGFLEDTRIYYSHGKSNKLSPLALLCQPVSDAIRYQL